MRTLYHTLVFVLLTTGFSACMDTFTEELIVNSPVYLSYEQLRDPVTASSARDLVSPGKIYFKDNYIFVVEAFEGIHLIDLSNPASPQNIKFIGIPGCVDIAVKGNILYADSYVDLVALDVADLNNIEEVARLKDVLPYLVPPTDNNYVMDEVDPLKGVVMDWNVEKKRKKLEVREYPVYPMSRGFFPGMISFDSSYSGFGGSSGSAVGVAGSMARFGLYDDYLYAVDNSMCYMIDVSNAASPTFAGKQYVGWNIETMFIYDRHMFLGTMSGMIILSLQVPLLPTHVSSFWHATACDPVVVADNYAYVTLRGGTACGSDVNRLDVIKLEGDYKINTLISSYNMNGPRGLGIDGETLFVCDGDAGLRVFNVADKIRITQNQIAAFPGIRAYDVIPIGGILFMIGEDGFYLYDYSDLQNIVLKGHIPVVGS